MKTHRVSWIDTAKFFAIFWIVYGHTYFLAPSGIIAYAYTFHLSVFWFISGFVFKPGNSSMWQFISKKFNRIMVPYYFFNFLILLFLVFLNKFRLDGNFYINFVTNMVLFLPNNLTNPLWFLPAMFIVLILNRIATGRGKIIGIILPFAFFFLYFFLDWKIRSVPQLESMPLLLRFEWQWLNIMQGICSGGVFFFLGRLASAKDLPNKLTAMAKARPFGLFLFYALAIGLCVLVFRLYYSIPANAFSFNRIMMFFALALLGVLLWTSLSTVLPRWNLVAFIGANTLIVFAIHESIFAFLDRLELICVKNGMQYVLFSQRADGIACQLISSFLLAVTAILLCIPVIVVLKKFRFTRRLAGG